ncbi:MAG: hypothetical protein COB94_010285 [Gammaproteobacteria bacterium]|nr:hypothetical protein [Gammaproteobacteria bacterium]
MDAVIDFDLAEQVIAKAHVRSSAIKGLINLVIFPILSPTVAIAMY